MPIATQERVHLRPRLRPQLFVVLVVGSIAAALSGCATDAQRTRTEGAAAGAVIGAVIGQAAGRNREATVAGAVVGAAVGLAIGDAVANKKEQYARREDELRAAAQRSRNLAELLRSENRRLAAEIRSLEQSLDLLNRRTASAREQVRLAAEHRQRTRIALISTERQIQEVRAEINTQVALVDAEERRAREAREVPAGGVRLVAAAADDLKQQASALELAKAQLEQIDRRRAY